MENDYTINKSDYKTFIMDLHEMFENCFNEIESGDENINYSFVQIIKNKYEKNSRLIITYETFESNAIKEFEMFYKRCKDANKLQSYFSVILELYDFLFNLYNFEFNIKYLQSYTDNFKTLTKSESVIDQLISYFKCNSKNNLNIYIDNLIVNLIENIDAKLLFVSTNLLTIHKNKNSFLSVKIIIINLIVFCKLNRGYKFLNTCLANIARILMPESNEFSTKMNLELYDNQFSDFEYNKSDARKLSDNEFKFLSSNFFSILTIIFEVLTEDCLVDFTNLNSRSILIKLIENCYEEKKVYVKPESSEEIKVYQSYLIVCFISDIFEFIFSNLYYLDEAFKLEENINIGVNPFSVFKIEIQPKNFMQFLNFVIEIIRIMTPNFMNMIQIFLKISELRSRNDEKIKLIEKDEDHLYLLFEPFNVIGFSTITWIIFKTNFSYFFPIVHSNLFLFETIVPIASALIKRGENFKYLGLEMIFFLIDKYLNEKIIIDPTINYSFEDIFKDLLQFIGGPDPEIKRIYVTKNILKFIKLLTNDAKKDFYINILNNNLKINSTINDAETSFIIYTLKNMLTDDVRQGNIINNSIFDTMFLKNVIEIVMNENLFVIDIIETISQGLNFIHFILLQDKIHFNRKLFNKEYLTYLDKKIILISSLIEKWVNSTDEEKMKHVSVDMRELNLTNDLRTQKEELQKGFELRKNQALICLNIVDNLEKLIRNILNSIPSYK